MRVAKASRSSLLGRIKESMDLKARKKKAVTAAKTAGVDGLLVTHLPDVRYLCGLRDRMRRLCLLVGVQCCLQTDGIRPRQRPRPGDASGNCEEAGRDCSLRMD